MYLTSRASGTLSRLSQNRGGGVEGREFAIGRLRSSCEWKHSSSIAFHRVQLATRIGCARRQGPTWRARLVVDVVHGVRGCVSDVEAEPHPLDANAKSHDPVQQTLKRDWGTATYMVISPATSDQRTLPATIRPKEPRPASEVMDNFNRTSGCSVSRD